MPPPFNAKEVCRYFLWIAIAAVAIGALLWFLFYSSGHHPIQSTTPTGAALAPDIGQRLIFGARRLL